MVGITPTEGGGIEETTAEILQRWDRAPFNNDERQAKWQVYMQKMFIGGSPPPIQPLCTFGYPELLVESPATFEVLITPKQTAMIFSTREVRHIHTDGRAHTPADERWPTFWGDSIGHWEGDTLVIDTIDVSTPQIPGGKAPTSIFTFEGSDGVPGKLIAIFSHQARFVERIRKVDENLLENEMTIYDPLALSTPWKLTRLYRRIVGVDRMVYQDCGTNERNPVVNGEYSITLP
jgi:hypothetical protein